MPSDLGPRYAEVPQNRCLQEVDALDWAETLTVQIGGWHIGVRVSTAHLGALLRHAYGSLVIHEPLRVPPPNLSLAVHPTHRSVAVPLHTLYRGCLPIMRSRSPRRLLDGLDGALRDFRAAVRPDVVALQALTVVDALEGHAAVVGRAVRYLQPGILRALEREGLSVADGLLTLIRIDGAQVEVEAPLARDMDDREVDALDAGASTQRGAAAGRYPVVARLDLRPQSPPEWVTAAMRHTRNTSRTGPQPTLEALAAVARSSDFAVLPSSAPAGGRVNAQFIRTQLRALRTR